MLMRFRPEFPGIAAVGLLAALAPMASAQQKLDITYDTFIDSGSPGTINPATGQTNDPGTIVNGQDIYSYGADGKVKAVTSSYSSSYPYVSATHVLVSFPQPNAMPNILSTIGSWPVASVTLNYYPFNDSLSVPDMHDNLLLYPLTQSFTVGNGTQSPLVPSTTGGATWDSYDGAVADAWATPGGDYDAANGVLSTVTDSTLPPSKGSTPFTWNITSLVNNPTTLAELENNGAMIKVLNEGSFPNNPPPPSGENDFVSFYSADYMTAMGTTNTAFEPNVTIRYQTIWDNAGATGDGVTWDNGVNQNWVTNTGVTQFTAGADVVFNDSNNNHYAVQLNSTVLPNTVTFNNVGNYTVSGSGSIAGSTSLTKSSSGTVTLSTVNTYTGGTTVSAGTLVAGVHGALPVNSAVAITGGTLQLGAGTGLAQVSSLSITGNGTLDINNNHIIINYGSGADPIASVAAWIKSGYNGGAWTGTGITSTAAQANSASYGIGYADSADPGNPAGLSSGQIEVKYTLLGDANLDGAVNGSDFAILAANFNKAVNGWDQGDFNYDGDANGIDFSALANNFNKGSNGAVTEGDLASLNLFAANNGLLADVPEPASMGLALLSGLGILAGRRRRLS